MSIYLDHAATSFPKAPGVPEAVYAALNSRLGNPGRSAHMSSLEASELLYDTRMLISQLFGFPPSERILFTSGATEGLNLILQGLTRSEMRILTTPMEHNSVARVVERVCSRSSCSYRFVTCDRFGKIDTDTLRKELFWADLFVFTALSNVTGIVNEVKSIIELCEGMHIPYCIDAAQAAGAIPLDLTPMHYGAVCFSGHKGLLGPPGTGAVLLGSQLAPEPLIFGGTGSLSDSSLQPQQLPDMYQSGTQNLCGIAGLKAALSHLAAHEEYYEQLRRVTTQLYTGLAKIESIELYSPQDCLSIASFRPKGMDLSELSTRLQQEGVDHRMGYHCSPWAHQHLGSTDHGGLIRFSVSHTTTFEELDTALDILQEVLA